MEHGEVDISGMSRTIAACIRYIRKNGEPMAEISGLLEILRASTPEKNIPMTTLGRPFRSSTLTTSVTGSRTPVRNNTTGPSAVWVKGQDQTETGSFSSSTEEAYHRINRRPHRSLQQAGGCGRDSAVGHRLPACPEFYFPAQVEDAVDAYQFLLGKRVCGVSGIPVGSLPAAPLSFRS